jgi:ATP-binding cassette subfamily F protein 3
MVTHSEMLLRRLADSLIIFHKGGATYFDGNYDDFLEKIGWEEEATEAPIVKKQKPKINQKEQKKLRSELIQSRSKESAAHKKELHYCEEKIMELEEQMSVENEKLQKASNVGDNSAIIELSQNVSKINLEIDVLFERLEVASEALDEICDRYDKELKKLG